MPKDIDEKKDILTVSKGWLKNEAAADVLDTIANLSNDEVFTPPKLARQVLDLLPAHVWKDSSLKFLDPCCKTGVFLREITKRLMVGLAEEFPCEKTRREHILKKQVYGIAITELTALMSRRTVYCASDATREPNPDFPENCFSAVKFDDPEGNIVFLDTNGRPAKHEWQTKKDGSIAKNAKCKICGASAKDFAGEDREGMESYAYPFIHMDMEEIWGKEMKFDVIIGNPPYQIADGGYGASSSPLYQEFVWQAKKLNPQYLSMIIKANWYTGGKPPLDKFRQEMCDDKSIKAIIDFETSKKVFPGVDVAGGICIFMRDKSHSGPCDIYKGEEGSLSTRNLDEFDVLVRDSLSLSVVHKALDLGLESMGSIVSARNPFKISKFSEDVVDENGIPCMFTQKIGVRKVRLDAIRDRDGCLQKWKVIAPRAPIAGQTNFSKPVKFYGENNCLILPPGEACSETHLILKSFEDEISAINFRNYVFSKVFRFLLLQRVSSQDVTRGCFNFIPDLQEYSHKINDEYLIPLIHNKK